MVQQVHRAAVVQVEQLERIQVDLLAVVALEQVVVLPTLLVAPVQPVVYVSFGALEDLSRQRTWEVLQAK
jgi:hypothetical protein